MMKILMICVTVLSSSVLGCMSPSQSDIEQAMNSITPDEIKEHLTFLSNDSLEGRAPASPGGIETAKYIATLYRNIGLEPAGENESYFQKVTMVGITTDPDMHLVIRGVWPQLRLNYSEQFMAWSGKHEEEISIDKPLVFVGYGIDAPEYDWNDYKDVDVSGKVLLMLVNDPPSDTEDPDFFGGKALTYYGRWTYKFEIAAEKGAAGAILIHTTGSAGYPWEVVANTWAGEQFALEQTGNSGNKLELEAWITESIADSLFNYLGTNLGEIERNAASPNFYPIPLGTDAVIRIRSSIRHIESDNVVGLLRGSDSEKNDEVVVYTSHWDHLGISIPADGDSIYNGAFDNASGVSGMLEIAEAFTKLATPPRRSILFLAVTAEEQGLLGSRYYVENPVFSLAKTVADINIDGLNVWGRTNDITVIGYGRSTLDDHVIYVAGEQGRTVRPDQFPEKGYFYRSDQFNFVKAGVPALYIDNGLDFVDRQEGWGKEQMERYIALNYHKPSDEFDPNWDLSGAQQDAQLAFLVGVRVANDKNIPRWKAGDEFERVRENSLRELKKLTP